MRVPALIGVGVSALVLPVHAALAAPKMGPTQMYNQRIEALFIRLDADRNGRLEPDELKGRRALERRLKREKNRDFLLLEDVRGLRGDRLTRRFHRADLNSDQRLSRAESKTIPWISRHFDGLDRNGDGSVTLNELWELQRSLAPRQRRP